MEKNVKKLIIAAAVMGSFVPAGVYAARESDEGLKEEAAAQEELTPVHRRKRLAPEERKQLDSDLEWEARNGSWLRVLDLLWEGADPTDGDNDGLSTTSLADELTVKAFVFAGADYSSMPSTWELRNDADAAVAEEENAFSKLIGLQEVLRGQMAENPQVSVEELARVSVDRQVPCSSDFTYKILNEVVAYEWKKIKKKLVLEREASRVLLDGLLLPVSAVVNIIHSYMYF